MGLTTIYSPASLHNYADHRLWARDPGPFIQAFSLNYKCNLHTFPYQIA